MTSGRPSDGSDDSFAKLFEQSKSDGSRARSLARGDEIEVTVVKTTHDAIFVDLDGKREAFIDFGDLVDAQGQRLEIPVGSRIKARVLELGGKAGAVRLQPVVVRQSPTHDENGAEVEARVNVVSGAHSPLVVGARVRGTVTRIESYGVFMQLEGTQGRQGRGLIRSRAG